MNDLGYGQLSNPNRSLKLVLMHVEIIENYFSDISTTLAKDFITSHSLSQSPQIPGVDDPILITQHNHLRGLHVVSNIWRFRKPVTRDS